MFGGCNAGWRVGDRIAIAPSTKKSGGNAEEFTIAEITGNVLSLGPSASGSGSVTGSAGEVFAQAILKAPSVLVLIRCCTDHVTLVDSDQHRIVFCAAGQRFLGSGSMRMEVVNLARNFVITGDDFTDESCTTVGGGGTRCTVGLHTIAIGDQSGVTGPTLQMKHTRVEKCGQRGISAKYEASMPLFIYFLIVSLPSIVHRHRSSARPEHMHACTKVMPRMCTLFFLGCMTVF